MTSAQFRDRLTDRTELAGVPVAPHLVEKLEVYFQVLSIWNRRINLTALDLEMLPAEAIDRLFLEPLTAARDARRQEPCMDIGSGGGSPAIPFALAADASELIMVESRTRKSVFLREAAHAIGLANARVLTGRFEDICRADEFADRFGAVTTRAVRLEERDWQGLLDVLKPGGSFFFFHRAGIEPIETAVSSARKTYSLPGHAAVSVWTK